MRVGPTKAAATARPNKTVSARVDPDTHALFKALTTLRGQNVGEALTGFIEAEVDRFRRDHPGGFTPPAIREPHG